MLSLSSLSLSLSLSFAASNPYLGNFTSMISTSHSHSLAVTDSHTHTLASFHSTLYLSRSLTVCVSTKPRHTHIWLNFLSILQTHTHTHSISLTLTQLHKHTHTHTHIWSTKLFLCIFLSLGFEGIFSLGSAFQTERSFAVLSSGSRERNKLF